MRVAAYDPQTGSLELSDGARVARVRAPELAWRDLRPGDLWRVELEPVLEPGDGPLRRRAKWTRAR